MQTTCSSCGAEIFPGARFCRRCGAPHRESGEGTRDVSPQSPTVPLREGGDGRATDGLDEREERTVADTSRVSQAELERLLRTQQDAEQKNTRGADTASSSELASSSNVSSNFERGASDDSNATDSRDSDATHVSTPAQTRPDARFDEEELTIPVPRPAQPFETREASSDFSRAGVVPVTTVHDVAQAQGDGGQTPAQSSFAPEQPQGAPATRVVAAQVSPTAVAARPPSAARGKWPVVAGVCAVVFLFAVVAAFVGWRMLRRPSLAELPATTPTATPAPDALQRFEEKLAEAESLLAAGNMDAAMSSLREANALDPSNTRAHRRLGELLLAAGARRDAIEEFRAVTSNAPDDAPAWRQLASAQFAEGLYREAADSFRRLIELSGGEQTADANDLLAYADALRLSGRTEEARSLYERLASSSAAEVASVARRHLAELPKPTPSPTPAHRPGETQETTEGETVASIVQPTPTPAPTAPQPTPRQQPTPASLALPASASPAEHYRRGVELWSSNRSVALGEFRAAASVPDAHYYLGLSYVEGRNIHSLQRAEVVAALQHFQIAERGAQHAAESRAYAQQLEKEFDRLRKQ